MRSVLVYGATSAIAEEAIRCFAADGDRLFLVARDPAKLKVVVGDAEARGASLVVSCVADFDELEEHESLFQRAQAGLGDLDIVLVAHGELGRQEDAARDFHEAEHIFRGNLLSAISLLTPVANAFEARGRGTIVVITSVAGDRGRQSNYVYGAAKGALTIYLQGLRQRLHARGVRVVTVKPGIVRSPMTAHLPPSALSSSAKDVGRGVYRAALSGPDEVYLPGWWRVVMGVIKSLPEPVFKRLSL